MLSDDARLSLNEAHKRRRPPGFPEAALRALNQERLDDRLVGTLRFRGHTIDKTSQIRRHFEAIGATAAHGRERLPQVSWLIAVK
jgi:hypothetical protein